MHSVPCGFLMLTLTRILPKVSGKCNEGKMSLLWYKNKNESCDTRGCSKRSWKMCIIKKKTLCMVFKMFHTKITLSFHSFFHELIEVPSTHEYERMRSGVSLGPESNPQALAYLPLFLISTSLPQHYEPLLF